MKVSYLLFVMVFSLILILPQQGFSDAQINPPNLIDHPNYAKTDAVAPACANDSDGDGICDEWEFGINNPETGTGFTGIHVKFPIPNSNNYYEYKLACDTTKPADCPSPQHRDVYVELDWMSHHAPDPQAIHDVVNAFANAPVSNPDGTSGINLHIQNGTTSTSGDIGTHYNYVKVTTLPSTSYIKYSILKQNFFGTQSEQNGDPNQCPSSAVPSGVTTWKSAASYNCLTAKRQIFHYGMFVNMQSSGGSQPSDATSTGWAEIPGNDFFISLGAYDGGNGNIDKQEGTLMHEIGHNLGLWHGGSAPPSGTSQDDYNCAPNYLSVMSYTYQLRTGPGGGVSDICRPLDFSNRGNLTVLNEQNLVTTSLGNYPYPANNPLPPAGTPQPQSGTCQISGNRTIWYSSPSGTPKSATTGDVIDWKNAVTTPNLNNFGVTGCNSQQQTTLSSFDDWHHLKYYFTNSSNFFGGPAPIPPGETEPRDACHSNDDFAIQAQEVEGQGNMTCSELSLLTTYHPEHPTTLTGIASDGTIVTVSTKGPVNGHPLELIISFTDSNGNKIEHQNYAIDITQNGNNVLSNLSGHTHTGDDIQTSTSLSSSDPVDIQITLKGIGLPTSDPSTWTGVKGEMVSFTQVIPEFGSLALVVLAIAIISIVFATKTRIIQKL